MFISDFGIILEIVGFLLLLSQKNTLESYINKEKTPAVYMLNEDGGKMLKEDGGKMLIEGSKKRIRPSKRLILTMILIVVGLIMQLSWFNILPLF